MEGLKVTGEWYFQYVEDDKEGPWMGPFFNSMTTAGLEKLATMVASLPSPFIAMGAGSEVFRKAVGAVIQSGAVLRFRATLSLSEGNGSHTWIALYSDATSVAGSGTKINQLTQSFSKTSAQVLNAECKFTFQQGV